MNKIIYPLIVTFAFATLAMMPPVHAQSSDDAVLQCVANCVLQEGEDETDTCKMRCAGIGIDMSEEPKDCMAVFKQCKKDCDKDKDCKQTCKDDLLNCV